MSEAYRVFKDANGVGQQVMASSVPVALASDQPAIPVSGTIASITADVPVKQGSPTKTTNAAYQAATSMAADIDCPAITVGPEGRLLLSVKWTANTTQIGTLVLQALSLIDGTTYVDIPGSSGAFTSHPNNDTAEVFGYFRELQAFTTVRLKYRRTSGGAAGNNFTAASRVM